MRGRRAAVLIPLLLVLAACSGTTPTAAPTTTPTTAAPTTAAPTTTTTTRTTTTTPAPSAGAGPVHALLPGMPAPLAPSDVYAADRPGALSPVVRGDRPIVYVPNSGGDTVTELDPSTGKVIRTFVTGRNPQHVVPSWDLRTLWVNNDLANTLTPIDPRTGVPGPSVPVHDPYNLYFTPDGRSAVVMASADREIVFRDPHTMAVQKVVPAGCSGVNHADFSRDGTYFVVSCEFSGDLLRVDTAGRRVVARLHLPGGKAMPQDVKMAPDGRRFYVADMARNGLWVVDGPTLRISGFLPTGKGAHGLYVTRDSRQLVVTNRDEGTVSLVSFATGTVVRKITIPGGGSPDMGGISVDGADLWVSGRYDREVYEIELSTGRLVRRIKVGDQPHGLCVFPQPGRYSLGHTGVFR